MAAPEAEGRGMRTIVLLVAVVIVAVSFAALSSAAASVQGPEVATAAGPTVPILYIQVIGESSATSYVFSPSVILLPQVPIVLNITFFNNQTAGGVAHTFTINDNAGNPAINTGLVNPQANVSFQFTINSMTNITYGSRSFQPGPPPLGTDNGTIQWYCIPHVGLGMKGTINLASAVPAAGQEQKGMFLRAYWIGIIGIAAMIVWVGISYFIIKSSTPRFKDNREHVRKGLP
jgi:plastocyanin